MLLCAIPFPAALVAMEPLGSLVPLATYLPLVLGVFVYDTVWLCAGISCTVSVCLASPPVDPAE